MSAGVSREEKLTVVAAQRLTDGPLRFGDPQQIEARKLLELVSERERLTKIAPEWALEKVGWTVPASHDFDHLQEEVRYLSQLERGWEDCW